MKQAYNDSEFCLIAADIAAVPICYVDSEERYLFVNRAYADWVGRSRTELSGQPIKKILSNETYKTIREKIDVALSGLEISFDVPITDKDGETRYVHGTYTPHVLPGKRVQGFVAVLVDVTRREQAVRGLQESEARQEALLNAIPDLLFRIGRNGTYLDFKPAKGIPLLVRPSDFLGKTIYDALPPELAQKAMHHLERALETGNTQIFEYRLEKEGEAYDYETRLVPSNEDEVLAIVHDVTERKRIQEELRKSEERLRQSQRLEGIGRLAGGIAHDFNNILTVIAGSSELLLGRLHPLDVRREDVEEIGRAAQRAASLTRQLLAFSRRQVLQPRVLLLNQLVTEMEKMLRRLIGEDIELVSIMDPSQGSVEADPGQLEQVLLNLAVNARDAMPQGGKLTIEVQTTEFKEDFVRDQVAVPRGRYVRLAVLDTGIGMDEDTRQRVFEPFFTTKEMGHGTGLGLATVYGIVRQSGGHIWVDSAPGQGASFEILLPRVEPSSTCGAGSAMSQNRGLHGSETILLVEDDAAVSTLARRILELHGYTVLEARDGAGAIRLQQEHRGRIDLMITDVVMPGMGGHELTKHLANMRPETKVLYMSGYADKGLLRNGRPQDGSAILLKPFTPHVLARRVREVLDDMGGTSME